jgi:hypothetical protein
MRSHGLLVAAASTLLAAVALTGCSSTPSSVGGKDIARKVNVDLEKKAESSSLVCPDIDFKVGAKVTCRQDAVLDGGRRVKVDVAVTMTRAEDSGKYGFDYKQSDTPTTYGLTGAFVAKDLKTQWTSSKGTDATVKCPDYLAGKVGAAIDCTLTADGTDHTIKVTVDKLDPATFNTSYTFAEVTG